MNCQPQIQSSEQFVLHGGLNLELFRRLLKHCVDIGASDILLQSGDYVWAEVQGRQCRVTSQIISHAQIFDLIPKVWSSDVISHVMSGKGADRPLDLYGEELGFRRNERVRFRCNFVQAQIANVDAGFSITMRVIPSEVPVLGDMGLDDELQHSLYPSSGLVLVCGPTGSGKTTLLSSVYRYALQHFPDRKVITYEDPVEFVLGGKEVSGPQPAQSQIGRDMKDFAQALRNAMRRKPDIIGIGEARDTETIEAMMLAGESGHLCFATVHTESVAETINRLIQVFPPAQQSAKAAMLMGIIRVVVIQRLVKTTEGKRKAIREYIIFDREMRNILQDMRYDQWPRHLRQWLEEKEATLDDRAWHLLEARQITRETFVEIAGYKAWRTRMSAAGKSVEHG